MRGKRFLEDLDRDIWDHIEHETRDNIERGMSPEEARQAAVRKFGNIALVKEDTRAVWIPIWIEQLIQDTRYSGRQVRRSPGFFAVAILLIALGVAASTQIFTLVDAVLLRPLPVRDAQNLVQLFELHPRLPARTFFEYGLLRQISEHSSTLTDVIGQLEWTLPLERGTTVERIHPQRVTDDYFRLMGVPAVAGRMLGPGDDHMVVLSHAYWIRSFGGDPKAVGQAVRLRGRAFQIIGVASAPFVGTTVDSSPDLWVPLRSSFNFGDDPKADINRAFMEIIGRLRPGATLAQAQTEAIVLWNQYNEGMIRRDPSQKQVLAAARLEVRSIARGTSPLREQSSTALVLLLAGTGLLLLMVSANVGGLLLSRASAREKETAVRLAVGASPWRVARLWFTESLMLATAGGVIGTLAAYATLPLLVRWLPPARGIGLDPAEIRTRAIELHPDFRVAAFGVAVCALVAVLAAIAPVWRSSRRDPWMALTTAIGDFGHKRLQSALCVLQVALCIVLLAVAGLMRRTVSNLRAAETGIDPAHIAIFSVDPQFRYTGQQTWSLQRRLIEDARALPGVESAAIASRALMRGIGLVDWAIFPGRPPEGVPNTSFNVVTPEYFDTMGIHLVAGRGFDPGDPPQRKPAPAVVNQAFAGHFFPGQNAIGQVFATGRRWVTPEFEIVGIVNDTKYRSLRETPPPIHYSLLGPESYPSPFVLQVRTHGDPQALIPSVRKLLTSLDPRMQFYEVATLNEEIDRSLWEERMLVALAFVFGVFAVALAAIGIYGILANFVTTRRREIGLRMALGAAPSHVGWLLAKRIAPTLAAGLAGGAALSFAAGTWVRSLLYGVGKFDLRSIGVALVAVLVVTIASTAAPTLRAIRVDPASTLRQE